MIFFFNALLIAYVFLTSKSLVTIDDDVKVVSKYLDGGDYVHDKFYYSVLHSNLDSVETKVSLLKIKSYTFYYICSKAKNVLNITKIHQKILMITTVFPTAHVLQNVVKLFIMTGISTHFW